MKHGILFLLVIIAAGCNNNSNPVSSATPSSSRTTSGGFGYVLNGTSVDRINFPLASSGSASLQQNAGLGVPANSRLLSINLMTEQVNFPAFHSRIIELYAAINAPVPATFQINQWDNASSGDAAIQDDTLEYKSNAGGTLVITKFDTVNNLVSGTFNFTAALSTDPSKTETVASGFFTDIPIYIGSFAQGSISANINGLNFISNNSTGKSLSAFTSVGLSQVNILAFSDDSSAVEEISITLPALQLGNFTFGPQLSSSTAIMSFSGTIGQSSASISSTSSAGGRIIITKCDTSAHRLSGTFNLSGQDASSGNTIIITYGVLDNVQWFDL
jgi:hypothetical protein